MINFMKLDRKELVQNGLFFETDEEAAVFAQIIRDELEVRIGERIADGLERSKLAEFDACTTQEQSRAWLEKNRPDYHEIVKAQSATLEREIMELRERIPGLVAHGRHDIGDWPIEVLELGVRSMNCLKRAGLTTIRDVMTFGDLSGILNLSPSCIEEIEEALDSLTDRFYLRNEYEYPEEDCEE